MKVVGMNPQLHDQQSVPNALLLEWIGPKKFNRDTYIIHLNMALSMAVSLYFGGTSHVSNGCKRLIF